MHALRTRALHLKMDFELKSISIKSKRMLREGLLQIQTQIIIRLHFILPNSRGFKAI